MRQTRTGYSLGMSGLFYSFEVNRSGKTFVSLQWDVIPPAYDENLLFSNGLIDPYLQDCNIAKYK